MTVIVSSGNQSSTAASYIPASYGTKAGVICVGASNSSDVAISMSNTGLPVDLLAPGNGVRVRTDVVATPFAYMTGTSPAAALVAGSALIELSINGSLTPAEVETLLKNSAKAPALAGSPKILRTTSAANETVNCSLSNPDGPVISPDHPASWDRLTVKAP
jgi:serine protease